MAFPKIILASQSPRRKQLLEWAEIDFDVVVSNTDEAFPADLTVEEIAIFVAESKANSVAKELNETSKIILAADTIVVYENQIIGKPKNENDAIEILTKLSDATHRVITGVCILYKNERHVFADSTIVNFNKLSKEQIEFYVKKYKPYDKAGAYAIQEWIGVVGIKSIEGSFYNVMGLPVSRVVAALAAITTDQS